MCFHACEVISNSVSFVGHARFRRLQFMFEVALVSLVLREGLRSAAAVCFELLVNAAVCLSVCLSVCLTRCCCCAGRVTNLRRVTYVVMDEADRMFDMGFEPQVSRFNTTYISCKQKHLFWINRSTKFDIYYLDIKTFGNGLKKLMCKINIFFPLNNKCIKCSIFCCSAFN